MSEEMESEIEHFQLDEANRMSEYPVFKKVDQVHACLTDMANKFKEAFPQIKDDNNEYIEYCFLITGTSGAFMAAYLSSLLTEYKISIKICRKESDDSHHKYNKDYDARIDEDAVVILLDDFACTGKTLNRIYEYFSKIKRESSFGLKPLFVDCVIISGHVRTERLEFEFKKAISHFISV